MKVALVHDWLTGLRGGERCLEAFLSLYPDSDIFTLVHVKGATSDLIDSRVKEVSFLSDLPGAKRFYRNFLPLYPLAISKFDFSGYDAVISLSHAAAKNISVPKHIPHISYCFTPMRYIWDQAYVYFGKATPLLWPAIKMLRTWDLKGSHDPRAIVAISKFVAARIKCFYGRSAEIVYPPVDTSWITPIKQWKQGEAFLYAGALVPYKRVDLVVDAFNKLGEPLWIVGAGPEAAQLKKIAKSNISFFGRVPDAELGEFYRHSRALIFPGTEDFGLIPVECMAAGRPVIGLDDGGLRESLRGVRHWKAGKQCFDGVSGVFFPKKAENPVEALIQSIRYFISIEGKISPDSCVKQAREFSVENFYANWSKIAEEFGIGSESYAKTA